MSRPLVLIVEDERSLAEATKAALEALQIEVHIAPDVPNALEVIRRSAPDLILLDIMLPEYDGLHLLRSLREDPEFVRTPVIVSSALDGPDDRAAAISAGADSFLPKPFTVQHLRAAVSRFLPEMSAA